MCTLCTCLVSHQEIGNQKTTEIQIVVSPPVPVRLFMQHKYLPYAELIHLIKQWNECILQEVLNRSLKQRLRLHWASGFTLLLTLGRDNSLGGLCQRLANKSLLLDAVRCWWIAMLVCTLHLHMCGHVQFSDWWTTSALLIVIVSATKSSGNCEQWTLFLYK